MTMLINEVTVSKKNTYDISRASRKIERLLHCVEHLGKHDRMLVEQIYQHGLSITEVAALTGKNRQHIRRRLDSLIRRANSPLFAFVILYNDILPICTRRTAELVVLQGKTLRQSSESTGCTLHETRQHMRTVRAMARV